MHAVVRRMPVERARHAKRLGHVQLAAAPDSTPSTTQVATSATSSPASSSQSSQSSAQPSSSPPPSSTSQSSSSTVSSATSSTPSASSSASSESTTSAVTPSSTLIPQSSTLVTQPTIPASTYPSSSPTSSPQTQTGTTTHSGLSGGAIAGIIAGAVIVGVALIVFFVRKTYLRRRERQDISWDGAPGLGTDILDEPKFPDVSERTTPYTSTPSTPQRGAPPLPFESRVQSTYSAPVAPAARMQPASFSPYAYPTPPPATYNNPTPVVPYPTQPVPSTYGPGNTDAFAVGRTATLASVRPQRAPLEAIVKCTFVPTLPDELSITTGERVFIVEQYDDGWDLCANARGEQGMVPRECLEHPPSDQLGAGWGNVRRMSSLNPEGKRF